MKILFAEDEKELSDAIVVLLKRNDYSVDAVYDGQEANDYLDMNPYDLVILDIMMPRVDGLQVLKHIREKGDRTPVLLLTAKSENEDIINGLDAGADDYLTKPFNFQILLARVRALTRRDAPVKETNVHYGNVTIERSNSTIHTDEGTINLVNKELQILELLMKNPEKIISTAAILNSAWNSEDYSTEENVYVFISYIRRKLKAVGANVEIKAYRNQGYALKLKND